MKTDTKFFDVDGNEVPPEKAVNAVKLTFDGDRLVKSITYEAEVRSNKSISIPITLEMRR